MTNREEGLEEMDRQGRLVFAMSEWEHGCPERMGHLLKVWAYARTLAEAEGLEGAERETVEAAALVHDIGIRPSLAKYGNDSGPNQEVEGPEPAGRILAECGYPEDIIGRVKTLVGHHHTYSPILGKDHQILLEADLLVNLEERSASAPAKPLKVFRTPAGIQLYNNLFQEARTDGQE